MENDKLTRRTFLKSGGALAAAIALTTMLPTPSEGVTLVDPYNGVVPMTFPIRRGLYWIFNNWHVPRIGNVLPYNHQLRSWLRAHDGIDIFATKGTALYACAPGIVVNYPRPYYLYGNYVWIQSGESYRFFYCHLDTVLVKVGQAVDINTVIGTVGNTGNAARMASHLHFEIHYPPGNTYACKYCLPAKRLSAINPYASLVAARSRG